MHVHVHVHACSTSSYPATLGYDGDIDDTNHPRTASSDNTPYFQYRLDKAYNE